MCQQENREKECSEKKSNLMYSTEDRAFFYVTENFFQNNHFKSLRHHLRFFLEKSRDFFILRFCDFFMYIVLLNKQIFIVL